MDQNFDCSLLCIVVPRGSWPRSLTPWPLALGLPLTMLEQSTMSDLIRFVHISLNSSELVMWVVGRYSIGFGGIRSDSVVPAEASRRRPNPYFLEIP